MPVVKRFRPTAEAVALIKRAVASYGVSGESEVVRKCVRTWRRRLSEGLSLDVAVTGSTSGLDPMKVTLDDDAADMTSRQILAAVLLRLRSESMTPDPEPRIDLEEARAVKEAGDAVNCVDGDLVSVARHGRLCASSWEPEARLIGNCRADDLRELFEDYLRLKGNGYE